MRRALSNAALFALGLTFWSMPRLALALDGPADTANWRAGTYGYPGSVLARLKGSTAMHDVRLTSQPPHGLAIAQPVGDEELADLRGGFSVGGINFNFGASVQTLVNGQLALQTNLQWTSAGAVVTQLQGLGTKIQAQVASTLSAAGIGTPPGNSTQIGTNTNGAPSTVAPSMNPSPSATATPPILSTPITTPPSTTALAAPASSPATTIPSSSTVTQLTGGSISLGGTGSSLPLQTSSNANIHLAGGSPAPTITVPVGASPGSTGAGSFLSSAPVASPSAAPPPAADGAAPVGSSPSSTGNGGGFANGVQIQSPTGSTDVLANISAGQIQNVVLNSASDQNIVQNTNIVLTIYNFSSWQQLLAQHAMAAQLASQVMAASGFIGGR